jgi:hypothetical protein
MIEELRQHVANAPLAIHVGTRDDALAPRYMNAVGIAFGKGDDELVVFMPKGLAGPTLDNLRSNGRIAVGLGNVATYKSYQVKGQFVGIADGPPEDEPALIERRNATIAIIEQYFGPAGAAVWRAIPMSPLLAVTFHVETVFDQTPGIGAGAKVS